MLRQEYVVAESRMTLKCRSNLAAVRMFRLNQQFNQVKGLISAHQHFKHALVA